MEPGETRWDEWDVSPEALQPLRPPEARSPIKRTVTTGRAAARAARTLLAPRARLERQRLALREAQSAARRVPQTHRHRVPTGQLNNAPSPPELGNFHESRPGPGLALPPPADGAEPNSGRQTLGGSGRYQLTVTAAASGSAEEWLASEPGRNRWALDGPTLGQRTVTARTIEINLHKSSRRTSPAPGRASPPPACGAEPNSGRQTLGGSGRYQRTVTAAASGGKRTVTAGSRRRVGEEDVFV
jgi:hypothetical protein